jgi:hypothetical protein
MSAPAKCTAQAPAKPASTPLSSSSSIPSSSSLHRSPECDFTKVIAARAVVTRELLVDRYSAYDLFLATRNNPDPSA